MTKMKRGDMRVEQCHCCHKASESIDLAACANCEKLVCEDCYYAQGGGAMSKIFPICKECQKELTVCSECSDYIPDDFIEECPACKQKVCTDCMEQSDHKCPSA